MNFDQRNGYGNKAEQDFKRWVHMQPGWHVEPYGQGLMTDRSKEMMRQTPFNGDTAILEELLSDLRPGERNVYMDRVATIPNLTRWMPDFVVSYRNSIICAPDVKTSISETPNWAVEMSSILGAKLHSKTGVQCVYAFSPTPFVDYWSCASPDQLRDRTFKVLDGKRVRDGSGTPFYLVPKRAIDIPFRKVMTEIELNGTYRIQSSSGSVLL
jgi:hypothetical protein